VGVLLALRRHRGPSVARFLNDADPRLVLEAARAIHDVPIDSDMPRLAALEVTEKTPVPLLRRVANANFRTGGPEAAKRLAAMATCADLKESIRLQAIEMLGEWASPSGRDKVMGLWRPIAARSKDEAIEALRPELKPLLASSSSESVRQAAVRAASGLGMKEAGPYLANIVADSHNFDEARAEGLAALNALGDPRRTDLARDLAKNGGPKARVEATRVLLETDPAAARISMDRLLEKGTPAERQGAFGILANRHDAETETILLAWLDRLIAGNVPAEIQLDLIEASRQSGTAALREKLGLYEASRPKAGLPHYRCRDSLHDLQ
jgi:quinoprotein glucose dehydrogenase